MFEVIQLKLIKFLDYAFVKFKAEEDHQVALDPKTFANLDVHLNIKVLTINHKNFLTWFLRCCLAKFLTDA